MDILLKNPLRFRTLANHDGDIFGDPIWWSRGIGDNPIDEYINNNNREVVIDRHIITPTWALAHRGLSRHQHFLYIECAPQKPKIILTGNTLDTTAVVKTKTEEVGLFRKKYFTRREFDDGYAVRRGKRLDISGAELRVIHLTKYNMIICPKQSPIIMGRMDSVISKIMDAALDDRNKVHDIAQLIDDTKRGDYERYSHL